MTSDLTGSSWAVHATSTKGATQVRVGSEFPLSALAPGIAKVLDPYGAITTTRVSDLFGVTRYSSSPLSPDLTRYEYGQENDEGAATRLTGLGIFDGWQGKACRALCWAAGTALCAAVACACAIGTVFTIGAFTLPCSAVLIAACAAGAGAASICSDLCTDYFDGPVRKASVMAGQLSTRRAACPVQKPALAPV